MSTAAIFPLAMVLLCGLAAGAFNLAQKALARTLEPMAMVVTLAGASVPLFAVAVALRGGYPTDPSYYPPALASTVVSFVGHLSFIQAIRVAPISRIAPLLSLTPVFTAIGGFLLLGERPTLAALAGIVLVVTGALWLNAPRGPRAEREPLARPSMLRQSGFWLAVMSALCWSVSVPFDKMAVLRASSAFHGLFLTGGILVGALLFLWLRGSMGSLGAVRGSPRVFLLTLAASTLALVSQLVALGLAPVAVVETVRRGVANLMAIGLGRAFFHEVITLREIFAALLMIGGVALILL